MSQGALTIAAHHPYRDENARADASPDAEASLPDLGNVAEVVAIAIEVRDDVIQPGADNSGRHSPNSERPNEIIGSARDRGAGARILGTRILSDRDCDGASPAPVGDPYRNQHGHADGNSIGSNVERSE